MDGGVDSFLSFVLLYGDNRTNKLQLTTDMTLNIELTDRRLMKALQQRMLKKPLKTTTLMNPLKAKAENHPLMLSYALKL
jgi:hypothetical protein